MKTKDDLKETQRLPAQETMADLVASDPGRYYAHRRRIERVLPVPQPPRQWRVAGLLRLLRDLALVVALAGWTFAARAARAGDCGSEELARAQATLTAGALLLASPDPAIAAEGLRLMDAGAARRDAVLAVCRLIDSGQKRWEDDPRDLAEAAAVLGLDPSDPGAVQKRLEALATAAAQKPNPWSGAGD